MDAQKERAEAHRDSTRRRAERQRANKAKALAAASKEKQEKVLMEVLCPCVVTVTHVSRAEVGHVVTHVSRAERHRKVSGTHGTIDHFGLKLRLMDVGF